MAKKVFWPAFGCTLHQKAGRNTQQDVTSKKPFPFQTGCLKADYDTK